MEPEDIDYVDIGTYDARENMARDERALELASREGSGYLRVAGFEEPSLVLARRTDFSDIQRGAANGFDYTRRETAGSTIPCMENGTAYTVAVPTEYGDPDAFFRDEVGPVLADVLSSLGVEEEQLGVGDRLHTVRYGEAETPGAVPDGYTVVGSSLWSDGNAMLCHGVIALEPWDADELDRAMDLRDGEKELLAGLPSVSGITGRNVTGAEVAGELVESFSEGGLEQYSFPDSVELVRERYGDENWIRNPGRELESGQGHCFVDIDGETFF